MMFRSDNARKLLNCDGHTPRASVPGVLFEQPVSSRSGGATYQGPNLALHEMHEYVRQGQFGNAARADLARHHR